MEYEKLANQTFEIPPKHNGWKSTVSFSRWQKYGKDRLYYYFNHYDRQGTRRNHYSGKGYIDLQSGKIVAPPSDKKMIKSILEGME